MFWMEPWEGEQGPSYILNSKHLDTHVCLNMPASKHNSCHNICRVLELKHEMMNLELLEFHYFDDILADMKLTPVSYSCHAVVPNKVG